jgi:hypothetical protein
VQFWDEPDTWKQAITRPDTRKWIKAMNKKMIVLEKSGIYILVKNYRQKTVGYKWVF